VFASETDVFALERDVPVRWQLACLRLERDLVHINRKRGRVCVGYEFICAEERARVCV